MFGTEAVGKGLSFVKILSGLNKTLSIANQVIPIYQQAKPMIQNAKSAFRVLKEFSTPSEKNPIKKESKTPSIPVTTSSKVQQISEPIGSQQSDHAPVFFL
ncbi:MAG: hypothetical protein HFH86_00795 [Bacilli bacterium]|nr:hypothetical protein [Bacilli bacterium]